MAQVAISFGKRTYRFECSEAEVERLEKLAKYLKAKLDGLLVEHGTVGDERLMVMAALTLTDELFDARADIDSLLEGTADEQSGKLKSIASQTTISGTPADIPRKFGV